MFRGEGIRGFGVFSCFWEKRKVLFWFCCVLGLRAGSLFVVSRVIGRKLYLEISGFKGSSVYYVGCREGREG